MTRPKKFKRREEAEIKVDLSFCRGIVCVGGWNGTDPRRSSERPPSRGLVDCSFLISCLSYRLVLDARLPSSCNTRRIRPARYSLSRPHCLFPFSLPFPSFPLLVLRSRTTFIHTKATATQQPYAPTFIPFQPFLYVLSLPFIPHHWHLRGPLLLEIARMYLRPPSGSSRRALSRQSRFPFFAFSSTGMFSLLSANKARKREGKKKGGHTRSFSPQRRSMGKLYCTHCGNEIICGAPYGVIL